MGSLWDRYYYGNEMKLTYIRSNVVIWDLFIGVNFIPLTD